MPYRCFVLTTLSLVAVLAIVSGMMRSMTGSFQVDAAQARPSSAQTIFPGDIDCSGATDVQDALSFLKSLAGFSTPACQQQYGDVDCDRSVDTGDLKIVLAYSADVLVPLTEDCPAVGGPPSAEALTDALSRAGSADDAQWVLKLIYQRLDIGLYTRDGQQILAGSETGPQDFYLYDFESHLIAGNYFDGQPYGLDTTAAFLNEAGVPNPRNGNLWTRDDVLALLEDRIANARNDGSMFVWRLIDDLGLTREDPLDLTNPGLDSETTSLDALQTFLVLHSLVVETPGSASVQAAPAEPGPSTKALHDYALLAQGYHLVTSVVQGTRWKQDEQDSSLDRKLDVYVGFERKPEMMGIITSGPLKDVALPPTVGVPGAILDWFPDATTNRNGSLLHESASKTTDAHGFAFDTFVPRTICFLAKPSEISVIETGKVGLVGRVQLKSVFPPHNVLDTVSLTNTFEVDVRHYLGSDTPAAVGGVTIQAITELTGLPCEWTVTSHATTHHFTEGYSDEVGSMTASFTFADATLVGPNSAEYDVISGSATWQSSGHVGSCTWDKHGTEDLIGTLTITSDGAGHLTYGGLVSTAQQDRDTGCIGEPVIVDTDTPFSTCGDAGLVTGLSLMGNCTEDNPQLWHDAFEWELTAEACSASAVLPPPVTTEGTCGP